jgi:hypothetical protein
MVQRAASGPVPWPVGPVGLWHAVGCKTAVGRNGWPSTAAQAGLAKRRSVLPSQSPRVGTRFGAATGGTMMARPVPGLHG